MTRLAAPCLFLAALALPAAAQDAPPPIQDNSFLIEEAYNQEGGVVQHISLFQWDRPSRAWGYAFTQEWPFRGQRHQLSYTVPVLRIPGPAGTGLGDLALNYRLQAVGGAGRGTWVAPRLSVVLPTGGWREGRGDGSVGVQLALPASVQLGADLVTHLNAGVALHPRARNELGDRATASTLFAGASLVYAVRSDFNLMLEGVVEESREVAGPDRTASSTAVTLNPGVRWAHNLRGGLQVVPGIAYAIGLADARASDGLVLYLSFEHPFRKE